MPVMVDLDDMLSKSKKVYIECIENPDTSIEYDDIKMVSVKDIKDSKSFDIVFCKECRHRGKMWREHLCDHPKGILNRVKPDDFCSYGER